jgi:CheY-like chemotaxis protein
MAKILIANEQEINRNLLSDQIKHYVEDDHDIIKVRDRVSAAAQIERTPVDVAIFDNGWEDTVGRDIIKQLRAQGYENHLILYTDDPTGSRELEQGALAEVFERPREGKALCTHLNEQLGQGK